MGPNEKKQNGLDSRTLIDDEDIVNEEEYIDGLIAIFTSSDEVEEDDDINDFLQDFE